MARFLVATIAFLAFSAHPAQAVDIDFDGIFTKDNDKVYLNFSVSSQSRVTIFSSSWLYGKPPSGASPGGFDPMLTIWDGNGVFLRGQDDGNREGTEASNGFIYNYGVWDSYFLLDLSPGEYTAVITQYDNLPNGTAWIDSEIRPEPGTIPRLGDGFLYDDIPNFTSVGGYGNQPFFNGIWSEDGYDADPRGNNWAFHILNVEWARETNPVPEPASAALLAGGLAGVEVLRRKIRRK